MYDPEAAQQLEATVAEEKVHVQRCKETVDDLASHLAGAACIAARSCDQKTARGLCEPLFCLSSVACT